MTIIDGMAFGIGFTLAAIAVKNGLILIDNWITKKVK